MEMKLLQELLAHVHGQSGLQDSRGYREELGFKQNETTKSTSVEKQFFPIHLYTNLSRVLPFISD